MSTYGIVVFLHIVGALGLFVGIGLEQVSLARLREVGTTNQARDWLGVLGSLRRVDAPSGLLILATGIFMMVARWGHDAWIGLAIVGMVLMAVLSIAVTSRRARALNHAIGMSDGGISSGLRARLSDPLMRSAAMVRAAIALGIVFNMALKPAAPSALAAFGIAVAAGVLVALTQWNGRRDAVPSGQPTGESLG
ncbi:MAG TPA: hypothetical protein VGH98_22700 [Gemmatimonadaceae bacterium]